MQQRCCCLEMLRAAVDSNVDWPHLVLVSGKPVLRKTSKDLYGRHKGWDNLECGALSLVALLDRIHQVLRLSPDPFVSSRFGMRNWPEWLRSTPTSASSSTTARTAERSVSPPPALISIKPQPPTLIPKQPLTIEVLSLITLVQVFLVNLSCLRLLE